MWLYLVELSFSMVFISGGRCAVHTANGGHPGAGPDHPGRRARRDLYPAYNTGQPMVRYYQPSYRMGNPDMTRRFEYDLMPNPSQLSDRDPELQGTINWLNGMVGRLANDQGRSQLTPSRNIYSVPPQYSWRRGGRPNRRRIIRIKSYSPGQLGTWQGGPLDINTSSMWRSWLDTILDKNSSPKQNDWLDGVLDRTSTTKLSNLLERLLKIDPLSRRGSCTSKFRISNCKPKLRNWPYTSGGFITSIDPSPGLENWESVQTYPTIESLTDPDLTGENGGAQEETSRPFIPPPPGEGVFEPASRRYQYRC